MHNCFLLLGSNEGNRLEILNRALQAIRHKTGKILLTSSVYESEPWGFDADRYFLNLVIQISTELTAGAVLRKIQETEHTLGRVRNSKGYASRKIDIDILFYDDDIVEEPELQIPHPRLHERMFTLILLNEICPDKIHPVFGKTISELLAECTDNLVVKKYKSIAKAFAE
jgi:2-amino-4-hydroxy-6-hydroxymethyldihydropteridine diphosphokinase